MSSVLLSISKFSKSSRGLEGGDSVPLPYPDDNSEDDPEYAFLRDKCPGFERGDL